MTAPRLAPVLLACVATAVPVVAQASYDPNPAEQLRRLEPLVGSWSGAGKMYEPTGDATPWTVASTYRWALNGHFLQEDVRIDMEGLDVSMVFRNYIGWDRERGRYVVASLNNEGRALLKELQLLPDGTLLKVQTHHQQGLPYNERERLRVDGDRMTMRIDLMMSEGDSMKVVDGVLERGGEGFAGDWSVSPWFGSTPGAGMKRLARMAGSYETEGEMVPAPGAPSTGIRGSDQWQMVFGGTGMVGRTTGKADGAPGGYESYALWGWDVHEERMNVVYVDSMGQVGEMQCRWYEGKLVSTMDGVQMGVPTTQRYVVYVDERGHAESCKGHSTFGDGAPFLSFTARYRRK